VLGRSMLADGDAYVVDLKSSHGSWMVDAITGGEFLDFNSGHASQALTYGHPALDEADFTQRLLEVARYKPANSDRYTTYLAEFVDVLASEVIPESHPHLFFVEGGAAAVENAMKVAFDWKVRLNRQSGDGERGDRIMHFRSAFHGRLGYTISVTNTADPRKYKYFPRFADWPRFDPPHVRFPLSDAENKRVELEEERVLGEMREYLDEHALDVAAILIEPIQGEGGDNHFRRAFLQGLRDLADRYDVLLIFDEIQTGMGLTGSWWYFEQVGVSPDVFTFAKKMQTGGVAVSRRVDEVADNVFQESSRINSTWGGDLTDMVRATQIIRTILAQDLLANARDMGERLVAGLREIASEGAISNVRGCGLMVAFDVESPERRVATLKAAYGEGVLLLGCGERSVRLRPFLDVHTSEVEEFLNRAVRFVGS
jgi:L-lysine 6-transaminase